MNTIKNSLGTDKTVRGYTIKRLHLGGYVLALDALGNLPEDAMKQVLPEGALSDLTVESLMGVLTRALRVVPEYAIRFCAQLLEVDEAELKENREIGLDGLMELLNAWVELNGVENFIKAASMLKEKWTAAKNLPDLSTGFKGLLLRGLSSVLAKKSS